jgi:cytochrome c oxidase subunit 2
MIESLVARGSSYAGDIDNLFTLITILVGFWFIVAEGALFYFVFKFKRKEGVKAQYITGEVKSQKKWINIPHILVILCDVVIIVGAIMVWFEVKQSLPTADEKIRVITRQWAFVFVHPGPDGQLDTDDDIATVDELHVKKDTTYHYLLEAKDVVHCFSVPVFRLKQDAIPGREITGWFKPIKEGEFDIQCAEICGIGHGLMAARLFVENAEQHQKWMGETHPFNGAKLIAASENGMN